MRYVALCLSVLVSVLGIYASARIMLETAEVPILVFFAVVGSALLAVLLGTAYGMFKEVNRFVRGLVAGACYLIPVAWLIGCLDVGVISGLELMSVFLVGLFSLVQWYAFESFRLRAEG